MKKITITALAAFITLMTTGSIVSATSSDMQTRWPVDSGDYYQGANRPQ
jgi:hypothetical protein